MSLKALFSRYEDELKKLGDEVVQIMQNLSGLAKGARSIENEIFSKEEKIANIIAREQDNTMLLKHCPQIILFQPLHP